jgi:hypothetical protein
MQNIDPSIFLACKPIGRAFKDFTVRCDENPMDHIAQPTQRKQLREHVFTRNWGNVRLGASQGCHYRRRHYVSSLVALIEGCALYEKLQQ